VAAYDIGEGNRGGRLNSLSDQDIQDQPDDHTDGNCKENATNEIDRFVVDKVAQYGAQDKSNGSYAQDLAQAQI
jgi:hypothetical protein